MILLVSDWVHSRGQKRFDRYESCWNVTSQIRQILNKINRGPFVRRATEDQ